MVVSRKCVHGEVPTRQVHNISMSLEMATLEIKSINMTLSFIYKKSVSKAVFSRMQLTLHATRPTPHGASRLVQAMSAWSVKTRRAPSRHRKDAKVYGHVATAMHDMSTPPSPLHEVHSLKSCFLPRVVSMVVGSCRTQLFSVFVFEFVLYLLVSGALTFLPYPDSLLNCDAFDFLCLFV